MVWSHAQGTIPTFDAIALTMKSKRTWKKRPKFNPSRLPKFRSEEAAWESVNSHRQHYHDSLHKVEHILSEVTIARGTKLKNYEVPEIHQILPRSKIPNKHKAHAVIAPHFHTVKRTRNKIWNKLATPTPKATRKAALSQAIVNVLKTNESRKPKPPSNPKVGDRLSAKQRATLKVSTCQNNPEKAQELRERINEIVKQKALDLFYYSQGKNVITHHKKNVHTFSPQKRKKHFAERSLRNAHNHVKVKKRRKEHEEFTIKRRLEHANKNERLRALRNEQERMQTRRKKLLSVISLVNRTIIWAWKIEEGRLMQKAKLRKLLAIRRIQGWWRKMLEKAQTDAKIKMFAENAAARVIQRFYQRYICKSSGLNAENAVEVIKKFLIDYQRTDSNFSKLVKRYRYKAVTVQRLWRRFSRISKARLKVLGKLWDEKESTVIAEIYEHRIKSTAKMKAAQKKALKEDLEAMKKNRAKDGLRRQDKKKKKTNASKVKNQKNEDSGINGQLDISQGEAKEKRLSIPPKEVRRLMIETLRKSRRKPEPGEIGAAAKGLKSMKIDRKIKMKLLKRCLREKRLKFRESIPEMKRKERQRQIKSLRFTMEEVRTLVNTKKKREGSKLLNDKLTIMGNKRLVYRALMLYVYSVLRPNEIRDLIEEGLEMTEAMYTKKSEKMLKRKRQDAEASVSYVLTNHIMEKVDRAITDKQRKLNKAEEEKKSLQQHQLKTETSSSAIKEDQIVADLNLNSTTEITKISETHDQNLGKEDGKPGTTFITTLDVNHKDFGVSQPKRFQSIGRSKKTSDSRVKEANNNRSYLTGEKVFEVFSFDTRFGWIQTADLPKYISGELKKYKAGDKEEQIADAPSPEKEDDHTGHDLPLEERLARSVVKEVFAMASSHVYEEFKQVSQPFVDYIMLQSVKNAVQSRL